MGEVFAGRYELVDLLGEGGMGSVWRAWDRRRQVYCAAKVLKQSDAASLLRFVREQALRIVHPHVLAPRGWVAEDDRVLFTMDIVGGGSVATLLGDFGPLPQPFAVALLDQLLDGLAAVHAAGVVHRDVKPANLLLEPTGTGRPVLRLSDFGVAVHLGEPRLTDTGLIIGTPGFVAPELRSGAGPDPRQDLYAAGMVGRQLLTGELDPVPPQPGHLAPALWDLLEAMTAADPAARPASATAARDRLGTAGRGLPWQDGGEPVDVLDHRPPLPAGWSATGPAARTRPAPRPAATAPQPQPTATESESETARHPPPTKVDGQHPALAAGTAETPQRRPGRPAVLATAGVVVIAVLAIVLGRSVLFDRDPTTTPGQNTQSPTQSPTRSPTTAPTGSTGTQSPGVVMPTYDIS